LRSSEIAASGNPRSRDRGEVCCSLGRPRDVFTNVVSAIAKEKVAKNGILIVIDEFDQISGADLSLRCPTAS